MKTTVMRPVEIEVKYIQVYLPVRYEDEDIPYDFPLRIGARWEAKINIDNGVITDWPKQPDCIQEFNMYMKVCDSGIYKLLDENGEIIAERCHEYVPHDIIPGEYGDYVHLIIDQSGKIKNWPKSPRVDVFFEE